VIGLTESIMFLDAISMTRGLVRGTSSKIADEMREERGRRVLGE
jgi:hypothetical protein